MVLCGGGLWWLLLFLVIGRWRDGKEESWKC